jgi:hypothetical protein
MAGHPFLEGFEIYAVSKRSKAELNTPSQEQLATAKPITEAELQLELPLPKAFCVVDIDGGLCPKMERLNRCCWR